MRMIVVMMAVIVIVMIMIVAMTMIVRVMGPVVDADPAHVQVMTGLGGAAVRLVADHLLAVFAQPAVHQIVAG